MSTVENYKPLTVVEEGKEVTIEELAARVERTRLEHGELLQQYHKVWYEAPHTWCYTHFLGIGLMKCPNDLWMYQALMNEHRPTTIIETGTYQGASALWFAFLMDMLNIKDGRIFTVDIQDYRRAPIVQHPRITYLAGNSVNLDLVEAIKSEIVDGPLLICLDSDHSAEHVRQELELYAPLCKVGDWLIVEDTNIGWSDGVHELVSREICSCGSHWPIGNSKCPKDKGDRGARGGLTDYMEKHPGEWRQDVLSERYLLTMNPGGWLQRMGECNHG